MVMEEKKVQYVLFVLTAILTVTPFTLTLIGITQCSFILVTDYSETTSLEFGVWGYRDWAESCQEYPRSMDIDASWMTARVFSYLALFSGGSLVFFTCIMMCAVFSGEIGVAGEMGSDPRGYTTYGLDVFAYFFTGIFTGLILLFLNSNICKDNALVTGEANSCHFSSGAQLICSAAMLWFLATFFSMQLDIERGRNSVEPLTATYPPVEIGRNKVKPLTATYPPAAQSNVYV